jgi:hypothetical protein
LGYELIWTKKVLGYTLGDFFENSSGHPGKYTCAATFWRTKCRQNSFRKMVTVSSAKLEVKQSEEMGPLRKREGGKMARNFKNRKIGAKFENNEKNFCATF